MKKIIITIFLLIIALSIYPIINIKADIDDYTTFTEIIMADGKLISNFTDEEYNELAKNFHTEFAGISTITANKNVDVSISIDGNVVETRQNIDKNNTNLSINVTGNGTKTVTVNAGGSKTTKTIDFDTANSVNIS